MAFLKACVRNSVFFTSAEYISLPAIGTNGTSSPSSLAIAVASAVFPLPGGPARSIALPANL